MVSKVYVLDIYVGGTGKTTTTIKLYEILKRIILKFVQEKILH